MRQAVSVCAGQIPPQPGPVTAGTADAPLFNSVACLLNFPPSVGRLIYGVPTSCLAFYPFLADAVMLPLRRRAAFATLIVVALNHARHRLSSVSCHLLLPDSFFAHRHLAAGPHCSPSCRSMSPSACQFSAARWRQPVRFSHFLLFVRELTCSQGSRRNPPASSAVRGPPAPFLPHPSKVATMSTNWMAPATGRSIRGSVTVFLRRCASIPMCSLLVRRSADGLHAARRPQIKPKLEA